MEPRDKVETYQGTDSGWYWRVKAGNGRVIATGAERFESKANAKRAARRVTGAEPEDA
jgi:uncharacterized protein YegP (UPF0339 family)